jgi:hypothetical protein
MKASLSLCNDFSNLWHFFAVLESFYQLLCDVSDIFPPHSSWHFQAFLCDLSDFIQGNKWHDPEVNLVLNLNWIWQVHFNENYEFILNPSKSLSTILSKIFPKVWWWFCVRVWSIGVTHWTCVISVGPRIKPGTTCVILMDMWVWFWWMSADGYLGLHALQWIITIGLGLSWQSNSYWNKNETFGKKPENYEICIN